MLIQHLNWQWMQIYLWPRGLGGGEYSSQSLCACVCACRHVVHREANEDSAGWECWIRDDSQDRGIPSFHFQGVLLSPCDTGLWGRAAGGCLCPVRGSYDLMDVVQWDAGNTLNCLSHTVIQEQRKAHWHQCCTTHSCYNCLIFCLFALLQL